MAFWDGQRVTYGDGTSLFSPLTSLDVCAHEIAHGVCEKTARLRYLGESGAINEGLSDIWAACVEYWAASNKQTWQIGEDISLLGIPLRSMANPNASLSAQPDTYSGTYWVNPSSSTDKGGVHTNSGVANYWFYLVSQGGSGTNDLGSTYSVSGIGINSAASIVYQTERWKIPSNVEQEISFTQFREASISASTDLFGANSCQTMAVTNAWYAVGVGSSFQYTNVSVSGGTPVCTTGSTFSVSNLPTGCSVSWNCSSNLIPSSASGNQATFTANGNGNGWIKATVASSCGSITLPQTTVVVGIPTPYITTKLISGSGEPTDFRFTATPYNGAIYNWYVNDVLKESGIANTFEWYFPCRVTKTIRCTLTNPCGTSGFSNSSTRTGGCDRALSYAVSPNPASSSVTVSALSTKTIIDSTQAIYSTFDYVRVFDFQGNLKKTIKYSRANSVSLNIGDLREGAYIFKVGSAEYSEKHQVIVRK